MKILYLAILFAVRPVDPIAAETLDLAMQRSKIASTMIGTLEQLNVVLHIQSSRELPEGIGGTTRFVASRGPHRYLRITIAAQLPRDTRVAILAHELQHALEMAESGATDLAALHQLFAAVGRRYGEYFETDAAIRVERAVRMELREPRHAAGSSASNVRRPGTEPGTRRSLQTEPVIKFHH